MTTDNEQTTLSSCPHRNVLKGVLEDCCSDCNTLLPHTRVSAASTAPDELIEAFRDAAVKAHIGFKHEAPWEVCPWVECEDRRKMLQRHAAASPAAPVVEKGGRKLTLPELRHLSALLEAERESGSYAGPRERYYARTERLIQWCNEQIRER